MQEVDVIQKQILDQLKAKLGWLKSVELAFGFSDPVSAVEGRAASKAVMSSPPARLAAAPPEAAAAHPEARRAP